MLHPPIEPFASGHLDVGDGHRLYHEQCGRPDGLPLLYLHGGPGSGASPGQRRLFDPGVFRMVLFDQRGCGRSQPGGEVRANTSAHLVADIEALRAHLGIERWLVVGGSWGAGLALAYAAAHPAACRGLLLRAVFLGRASDLDWFFRAAQARHPAAWAALTRQLPGAGGDVLAALHAGLHGGSADTALRCALAWRAWEAALAGEPEPPAPDAAQAAALVNKYRVQSHYLTQGCFWGERDLLTRAHGLGGVPSAIVHGEADEVCLPEAARELHAHLPGSRLHWVAGCGHDLFAPAMARALDGAALHFARQGDFSGWGAACDRPWRG